MYGSTLNYIQSDKDFNPENRAGRNIRFGIREHGMCAIMNGIAYHGIFTPSGATFLVFADYCRPSIRLASLALALAALPAPPATTFSSSVMMWGFLAATRAISSSSNGLT